MIQADLFSTNTAARHWLSSTDKPLDMSGLLDRLTACCERPRYNFMILTLIAEASAITGRAGPYVRVDGGEVPVRDWLCDAMNPVARREPRRLALMVRVRDELAAAGDLPGDEADAARAINDQVKQRLRQSGRTNVSRAVSELVRAGLLQRHYQGYRVDHSNRGAQRQAVYTITEETRSALARAARREESGAAS